MNSESAKGLLKWWIQHWFADTARRKVCDLVLVTSGGRFNLKGDDLWRLLVPQFPRLIGGDVLIPDSALNQANTVI